MSFLMPYFLMALGLSTGLLGGYWYVREGRIIRAAVWIYVGFALLVSGFWSAADIHSSGHSLPGNARPTATLERAPVDPAS